MESAPGCCFTPQAPDLHWAALNGLQEIYTWTHVSLYPVPPAGDSDLDADLAPYAGAKGTLKLPYPEVDYALIERVVRRLLEAHPSTQP